MTDTVPEPRPHSTPAALRKLLVFQVKLAADALRDLLLSPVSVVLVLLDIVQRNPPADSHYQRLMALGRRSDRFINLFDHADPETPSDPTLDTVVARAEELLKTPRATPGRDGEP